MERQIATTSEQSARLLCCGVSADTADMCWRTILYPGNDEPWADPQLSVLPYTEAKDIYGDDYVEPAWSLSALLTKILPSDVDLRMLKLGTGAFNNPNVWSIMYSADLYTEHSDIFEACVLMAEKLVANGYKLNEQ